MAKKKGRNYRQGKYYIQNQDKYVGTKDYCIYRSSWEQYVFKYLDMHPSVIEWGSETVVIPYYDPTRERKRRYMVDIYMKVKGKDGDIHYYLAEIKPASQVSPPVKTSRKRQDVFESEQQTYITNQLKWEAAKKFCQERGWNWMILTEYEIFKKK